MPTFSGAQWGVKQGLGELVEILIPGAFLTSIRHMQ
jgi:hypothetical protein